MSIGNSVWFLEDYVPKCSDIFVDCKELDLVKCPECGDLYCEHAHLDCHGCEEFTLDDLMKNIRQRRVEEEDLRDMLQAWFSNPVSLYVGNLGLKPSWRRTHERLGYYIEFTLIDNTLVDVSAKECRSGRYLCGIAMDPIHMIFQERSELVIVGSAGMQKELTEVRISCEGHLSVIQPPTL